MKIGMMNFREKTISQRFKVRRESIFLFGFYLAYFFNYLYYRFFVNLCLNQTTEKLTKQKGNCAQVDFYKKARLMWTTLNFYKGDEIMNIYIKDSFIKLQQALKLAGFVDQGSDAKMLIQEGNVKVNGAICTMRGKKLTPGDKVEMDGESFIVSEK